MPPVSELPEGQPLRKQSPGQDVTVRYWRDGAWREVRVTCDAQP